MTTLREISPVPPRPLKILLLEDDPLDQHLIVRHLRQLNTEVEVIVASKRIDFVRCLLDFVPDLIISDYHLQNFNGTEALFLVRKSFPKVPFIILTGLKDPQLIESLYQHGISACVSKDNLSELGDIIQEAHLRNKQYHSRILKVRVLQQLRTQLKYIENIKERALTLSSYGEKGSQEQSIQDFHDVKTSLEELYSKLQRETPIP
ncbi:MAG: response regulator [Bacteroidia bacterium]|nr:response regulator [Bacteroidia bacterium]